MHSFSFDIVYNSTLPVYCVMFVMLLYYALSRLYVCSLCCMSFYMSVSSYMEEIKIYKFQKENKDTVTPKFNRKSTKHSFVNGHTILEQANSIMLILK